MRVMRLCAYAVGMFIVAVLAGMLLRDDGMAQKVGRLEVTGRLAGVAPVQTVKSAEEDAVPPMAKSTATEVAKAPAKEMPAVEEKVPAKESVKAASPVDAPKTGEKMIQPGMVKALALAKAASPAAKVEREAMEKAAEAEKTARKAEAPAEKPVPEELAAPEKKAESTVPPATKAASTVEKKAAKPAPKVEATKAEKKPAARPDNKKTSRKDESAKPSRKVSAVDAALADARAGRLAPVEGGLIAEKTAPRYDRVVTSAKFSMKGSLIKLVLKGNAPMVGHYYVLEEPDRVVLDLAGNWHIELPKVPSNRLIASVRVGQHEDKTRLVFDMKNTGRVALVPLNRNSLELRIK